MEKQIARASKAWILVVEDDPGIREMIQYALEKRGLEVQGAVDGVQAWRYLLEDGKKFTAIVTDLQMPRMDGLALLKRVRQMENPPPVVMHTALLNRGLEVSLRQAGAFRVLKKGGPLDQFLQSVTEAVTATVSRPAEGWWTHQAGSSA